MNCLRVDVCGICGETRSSGDLNYDEKFSVRYCDDDEGCSDVLNDWYAQADHEEWIKSAGFFSRYLY